MFYKKRYRIYIIGACFIVLLTVSASRIAFADVANFISKNIIFNDLKPITETKDKLEGLSREEKEVLSNLFVLTQEILEMEKEEKRISDDIDIIEFESKDLEEKIIRSQYDYDAQLDILQQVLIGYQKRGPVSYIDTLIHSGDLKTFVRSLNIIREFSKNTASLLDSLTAQKEKLTEDKDNLTRTLAILEEKREELKEPLEKKMKIKEEQERYLQSLGEQRAVYNAYLGDMEQKWHENKEIFNGLVEDFGKIIHESNIKIEDLNINISFLGVTGSIYENTFNDLLADHDTLSKMNFNFHKDSIVIDITSLHLRLHGTFILEEGTNLKLLVTEGSFYDMPLEQSSIAELFEDGDVIINVKELVKDMVTIDFAIDSITLNDGHIVFKLTPKLF